MRSENNMSIAQRRSRSPGFSMSHPCLIVATGTHWFGAARLPKALANAGFEVALLAPQDSLAEKSRFVQRVGHLPDNASTAQWLFAFAAMVKATSPRIVVPGDEMSCQLMQTLVTAPPAGMQPAMRESLSAVIRDSLGDPAWYMTSADSAQRARAAAELGIDVVSEPIPGAPGPAGEPEFRAVSYTAAAWNGELLAGWATEKVVAHPAPNGPPSVVRRYRDQPAGEAAKKLVSAFGMSGLVTIEFSVDARTGRPLLSDIGRRAPAVAHHGAKIKVDLCAALLSAIEGRASPTRADLDDGETGYHVLFPQEWLRDPNSTWLKKYPVDVPWDEPELFEALLALRQSAPRS
jgi:hypothetical protein